MERFLEIEDDFYCLVIGGPIPMRAHMQHPDGDIWTIWRFLFPHQESCIIMKDTSVRIVFKDGDGKIIGKNKMTKGIRLRYMGDWEKRPPAESTYYDNTDMAACLC